MIDDLIIIIPTHNRQHYLGRVIKYYSSFPCKVYICDSSKQKADVESRGNIIYRWVPQSNFYGKVLDVISETNSVFYALSPDDDFLKQEVLMNCYKAIKLNERFSFGIGRQIFFKEGFKEGFYTYDLANGLRDIERQLFASKEEYVKYFWQHYQNILWSIYRKDAIKAAFDCLNKCNFSNGNFVEFILGIESLRRGKVYVSKDGLNYREVSNNDHWGSITPPIELANIRNNKGLKKDIGIFKSYYFKDGGFAEKCLSLYLKTNERKSLLSKIKGFIPFEVKIKIKHMLSLPTSIHNQIVYDDSQMVEKISEVLTIK